MIRIGEEFYKDKEIKELKDNPLFPSINVYGDENISHTVENGINNIIAKITNNPQMIIQMPKNYTASAYLDKEKPTFDYNNNKYFIIDGRELH